MNGRAVEKVALVAFAKRNLSHMGSCCLPFASRVALVLGASISIDMHGAHTRQLLYYGTPAG